MTIISLFTGAGGLDLGFKKSGFKTIWANDFDSRVKDTFNANFPKTNIIIDSLTNIDKDSIPKATGVIGGPPCQSFSFAGSHRGTNDKRGQLIWTYVDIIQEKRPVFFLFENVKGLISKKHIHDFQALIKKLSSIGYNIDYKVLNAEDFGVSQTRERLFILGFRDDVGTLPDLNQVRKRSPMYLKDTIGHYPPSIATQSGKTNNPSINAHEHLDMGFSSMFMSRNRVRGWNEFGFTVLATARQITLHPDAPKMIKKEKDLYIFNPNHIDKYRRLSVRECAAIQSFPDDFTILYSKIEDGYRMIGNAVPVNLANSIADYIRASIY